MQNLLSIRDNRWLLLFGVVLAAAAGCGKQMPIYPVDGKVIYEDGTAVSGGGITFLGKSPDGQSINASSAIGEDGSFALTTFKNHDGAVLGEHQAMIVGRRSDNGGDLRKTVRVKRPDPRYRTYESSGLQFVVKPETNHFTITVKQAR